MARSAEARVEWEPEGNKVLAVPAGADERLLVAAGEPSEHFIAGLGTVASRRLISFAIISSCA